MDPINFSFNGTSFHIEGFPDAIKVLKLSDQKSRRLADLALHKLDLSVALDYLQSVNQIPEDPSFLRQALWEAAIIRFIKCFGGSKSRFDLDLKVVYKGSHDALQAYNFFLSLRNKNIAHDDNAYMQCQTGAALNREGMDCKIAKIICASLAGTTLGQENYNNLHLLITQAQAWVISQFDKLCDVITSELEAKSYDDLMAMEGLVYTAPMMDDVHKARGRS